MEERKEKRHLQGVKNMLLAFAFCFICALFVGVSPVYAAKQECDYKITEGDQDFINYFNSVFLDSDFDKLQYFYCFSTSDSDNAKLAYFSDKMLVTTPVGKGKYGLIFPADTNVITYRFCPVSGTFKIFGGDKTYYDSLRSIYTNGVCNGVVSNYDVRSATFVDDQLIYSDTVFFSKPLIIAEMVREIPRVVRIQAKVILPIAVSCLALLTGCLVFLPKLKNFLH